MLREQFVVSYALTLLGTAVIMSTIQGYSLEVDYSLYVTEFLVLFQFLGSHKKSFSEVLEAAALSLFMGFVYMIILSFIRMLSAP